MRISTSTMYEVSSAKLSDLQSSLARQQQQIATGRRMMTPADDPVAAARAHEITQAQSANTQFGNNRQNVKDSLSLEEGALSSVTDLLQDVKSLIITAGNPAYDNVQRKFLAVELQGKFDQLLGLSNTRDGTGNYLFAGFQTTAQPFVQSATGATYTGDQGQRFLQVDASRQMAMSDSGDTVFEKNTVGNGTFVTAAPAANVGTGVVSSGSVVNSAVLTGHKYSVNFNVAAGATTYDVVDVTTGNPALDPVSGLPITGAAYVSGQVIAFDGLQLSVSGSPASGDSFSANPSGNQSVFTTLKNLINVLNTPATGGTSNAALNNGLNTANTNIGHALDNVVSARASIGARLNEIDALDSAGEDKNLQYAQTLSQLQDLDYTKAITELMQRQTTLTAAQQSFVKISGLSLFNYL